MSFDEEKLIILVSNHPEIYDIQNEHYMNSARKNNVWKEIAEELGVRGFTVCIAIINGCVVLSKDLEDSVETMQPKNSPVEVSAVFINCEIDDVQRDPGDEDTRFEREELFKHNVLRNCDKKLALTIKLTSENANSADEYVPIDHVLEGRSKKRSRLLNPYVLRIRRDAPLEAYKLRFIETVRGVLEMSDDNSRIYFDVPSKSIRDTENLNHLENWTLKLNAAVGQEYSVEAEKRSAHTLKLSKRHEKNVIIEENLDDITGKSDDFIENLHTEAHPANELINHNKKHRSHMPEPTPNSGDHDTIDASEKEFALYEVEDPKLWFDVHIHLFEKLSTTKGNTLWNDITKGASVSVGSMSPEWKSSDMSAQYKLVDFIPKEEFLYPKSNLRLLVPLAENTDEVPNDYVPIDKDMNFILVPSEDVLDVDATDKWKRTLTNVSTSDTNEHLRRVVVRVARTLMNTIEDKPSIITHKSEKYLTMPHRCKCVAQLDVEVRADDNQIVRVSAPGRIAIIVADNTRETRSTVTVQATNTGLVAALFRAQIRECDSGLNLAERQGIVSEPVLLPPYHTRRLLLRLPPAPAADLQHCSVYLLNANNESVAVRDAVIKKGDQCYCVWHCDCVCYGDNVKLPCQEMSAAQQGAAGLPARSSARYTRACQYADVAAINVAVVMVGVIVMLLCLGVLKGLLGLLFPIVGVWGLDRILEAPRHLDRYYESSLRCRDVVYDDTRWPVHPDTRQRTVRVVSLPVELILNVVFFVVSPCLMVLDALRQICISEPCVPPGLASRANVPKSVKVNRGDVQMFPLLDESRRRQEQVAAHTSSSSDSEQEDTAFVLMQMQKSSESLVKNQMKAADSGPSGDPEDVGQLQAGQGQTNAEITQP